MIKRETDYAIRTVVCLARCQAKTGVSAISTAELAKQTGVPYRFLRKIVLRLATAGILKSRRGRGGGLDLATSPDDITLLRLMQVMEPESVLFNQCMDPARNPCTRKPYCGLHGVFGHIQQNLHGQLANITLTHLATQEAQAVAAGL